MEPSVTELSQSFWPQCSGPSVTD
uniref:Uncharacterized protein n=1 Tax=Anguilla anguilla TaxID=7936 RepID=A0A0E9PM59_ANGAN